MQDDDFEWDERKSKSNYDKHGIAFDYAKQAFADPFGVEILDDTEDYREDRYLFIGMIEGTLFSVIYTLRSERFRLISARYSNKDEQDHYFRRNSEGAV